MVISHLSYQFSLTGMLSQVRLSYKVIFPSLSHGLIVWVSCNKMQFDELEQFHERDTRIIIFYLDCCFPLKKF